MVVGDDDLALPELFEKLGRNDVALAVIVGRIVRQQHAQPVANGDPRRDDQEGIGESRVPRIGELVERVPCDEHRHDHGLPGTGRHLEGRARKAWVGTVVRSPDRIFDPGVTILPGDLREVDGGFERFDLAEEQLLLAVGVGPIGEQACRGRRHADMAPLSPQGDAVTDLVDELVFLDPVLRPLGVEGELPGVSGLGDRDEIRAGPATIDDLVRDAVFGESEMSGGFVEGGVDDGVFDDDLLQSLPTLSARFIDDSRYIKNRKSWHHFVARVE